MTLASEESIAAKIERMDVRVRRPHRPWRQPHSLAALGRWRLQPAPPAGPGEHAAGSPPGEERVVAHSELFVGRSGHGSKLRRRFSALRVDVAAGSPLRLTLTPLLAEQVSGRWRSGPMEPITL